MGKKFYEKTHRLKVAADNHSKQIRSKGGKTGLKKTKKGFELTYYYPSKKSK